MYSVDRLNRQYEKLREAVEEPENVGPLESSVKSLQKEIAAVSYGFRPHRMEANSRGWPIFPCALFFSDNITAAFSGVPVDALEP